MSPKQLADVVKHPHPGAWLKPRGSAVSIISTEEEVECEYDLQLVTSGIVRVTSREAGAAATGSHSPRSDSF